MANATRISDKAAGAFIFSYAGTTAAQNIHLGFKPAFMLIYNQTDGDTVVIWCKNDITDYVAITTAAATNTAAVTQVDNGTVIGFSLAADAVLNENAKTFVGIAWPE